MGLAAGATPVKLSRSSVVISHVPLSARPPVLSILEPSLPAPHDAREPAALREALVFAFATGDAGDSLDRAVEGTPLSASDWQPEDFVGDVFLTSLIERTLPLSVLGQTQPRTGTLLLRILSSPPADVATTRFRQAVFAELLSRDSLRLAAEQLLAKLLHLRATLAKSGGVRIDALERRLSILRSVRDIIELAASGFAGTTSALARVARWGEATKREPSYARLVELLAYEECTAEVDVRLRLGVDGKIRDFEVLGRREPVTNSFHRSRAQKLFTKLSLFLQGDRFDDHELLARLVDDVFEGVVGLLPPLFDLDAGLELYVAGLAFHDAAKRAGLPVSLPTFVEGEGRRLDALWNPLLLSEGAHVVPCDLGIARSDARVVVTGPNSGGKTRLLQAVALTQILAQAGLFVPAANARLPWASGLFVSLIEHARADQAEGKLGTELLRIRRLFESLRAGSLVILDELCSGTNPDEGEDIFRLVVKLLGELHPDAFITTHFLRFAARLAGEQANRGAETVEGTLEFLQVELDAAETPTYQFVPGVANTSLAHRTAARLGVTEDKLRAAIRARNP
jgi:DNA mismatch repair protein MutS2